MGKAVGCCVGLDGQLQLSDYPIVDNDLQGDIADGSRIGESTLNLLDSKPRVFTNKFINWFYCFNDVSKF